MRAHVVVLALAAALVRAGLGYERLRHRSSRPELS